ncbi:unnamed protein product [Rotaria sp. Silwood2]|nr:unnamed protein product [Rotaria sp. Silwood2]
MPLNLFIKLFIFFTILCLSNSQYQYFQVQPHDISALIGSNITIPCVITSPHGDVQWTKDGLALGYDRQLAAFPSWSIIGDENCGEFNFFIESLKFEDEGIYACEVSPYNNAPALKQVANIKTLVRPEHVKIINNQSLSNETTIIRMRFDEKTHRINCRVDGARPAAHIKWINETGHEFSAISRTFIKDNLFSTMSTLTLIPSLLLHKKRFMCDVRHETLNNNMNLLRNGPVITRTQGYSISEALMPGSSAILICVIDGNPIDLNKVRWFKNNQELSFDQWEKRIEGNDASLIRKSINREDAGQYACEIDNQFGNSHATLPLIVQYAPEIDRSVPGRDKAATDSDRLLTAELHCYVSAIPKPTVIWMKDNQLLSSSSRYQSILNEQIPSSSFSSTLLFEAILYVYNVTKSDYGIYQCKVENKLGIDMIQIILTGLTIPDSPSQIHITNTSHSSVLISWTPGFDGGFQQTFQIRYRLSTDNYYVYENVPIHMESYDLKNLKLGSQYYISIRSNNSYHLSKWTDEIIISTSNYLPSLKFHLSEISSTNISFTLLILIAVIGLIILLINIILICFFIIKRRQFNMTSENSSTTGTNETETNTIDIFQPIPSNFFLTTTTTTATNTYKKYEDDDIKRPFVSSCSSTNLNNLDTRSSYASLKNNCISPYDNVLLHQYYPADIDNSLVTYRSFKDGISYTTDINDCIRTELV